MHAWCFPTTLDLSGLRRSCLILSQLTFAVWSGMEWEGKGERGLEGVRGEGKALPAGG